MFFNIFKLYLLCAETCKEKLRYPQTNIGREFIGATFKSFCKEKGITISYIILYIYEENGIAK